MDSYLFTTFINIRLCGIARGTRYPHIYYIINKGMISEVYRQRRREDSWEDKLAEHINVTKVLTNIT